MHKYKTLNLEDIIKSSLQNNVLSKDFYLKLRSNLQRLFIKGKNIHRSSHKIRK